MYNNKTTFKANSELPSNEIGDEFIILDSSQKKAHELNTLGKSIWKLLVDEKTINELKLALLEEFEIDEVTLDKDINIFLSELVEKQLVTIHEQF